MTMLREQLLDQLRPQILGSRILVISDHPADAGALDDLLLAAEFRGVIETAGRRDLTAAVRTGRPDLVLLDLAACGPEDLTLVTRVRAASTDDPFVPLLVAGDDAHRWRAEALAAGADDVVLKPVVAEELLARAHNLLVTRWLYRRQTQAPRQDPTSPAGSSAPDRASFLTAMADSLEDAVIACDEDGQVCFANSAAVQLGLGSLQRPFLAPGRVRSGEGRELALDEDPLHRAWAGHVAVDQELTIGTPERGVRTLLASARPIVAARGPALGAVVTLQDITDRRRVTDELRRGLLEDDVTGLPNAVLFLELVSQAVAMTARDHRPLSLIVITLDEVEEERDHDVSAGPLPFHPVLAALADRLPRLLRPGDIAARYGDGFALLCDAPVVESNARHIVESNAQHIVERLRATLSRPLVIPRGRVTPHLSFGVATAYDTNISAQRLTEIAATAARHARTADGGAEGTPAPRRPGTGW
jgi:diguanylate cyclase (GGDEF)-like protein